MRFTLSIVLLFLMVGSSIIHAQRISEFPGRFEPEQELEPFYHGVASGDPLSDQVIIWTRVTNEGLGNIEVEWEVALDTLFQQIVNSGVAITNEESDFTVKVDVEGLNAATYYFYRFRALDRYSVIGRTKTAPIGGVDRLRFGVVSCSNYAHGYFNAYERLAARNDVDAIIHLGDYIYEYGDGDFGDLRLLEPSGEVVSIDDYRLRHSHYKLDEDLRWLHQNYPFITVWDDHETANNSWKFGAENHDAGEGDWLERKSNGIQAYYEWMPIRLPDIQDEERIYRAIRYGDLMDLLMLDTRLIGRDEQYATTGSAGTQDSARTILGENQYYWLLDELSNSTAHWRVLGQQVMIAPVTIPLILPNGINPDQWDGYPAERQRILNHIINNEISNNVVLTGDIHSSWANDVPYTNYNADTGEGSALVEFVVTSVTSTGLGIDLDQGLISGFNPHIKFTDLSEHGYLILDVTEERVQGEWHYVNTVSESLPEDYFDTAWFVADGERSLTPGESPTTSPPDLMFHPPRLPIQDVVGIEDINTRESLILGAYPNPFENLLTLEYYVYEAGEMSLRIVNANGRIVKEQTLGLLQSGLHFTQLTLDVPSGMYIAEFISEGQVNRKAIMKR